MALTCSFTDLEPVCFPMSDSNCYLLTCITDISGGRSGRLVFPSLKGLSTVCGDPHSQRLWYSHVLSYSKLILIEVGCSNSLCCLRKGQYFALDTIIQVLFKDLREESLTTEQQPFWDSAVHVQSPWRKHIYLFSSQILVLKSLEAGKNKDLFACQCLGLPR